jgi:hypothetical protein
MEGRGSLFDAEGKLIYQGDWVGDNKQGFGLEYNQE